MMAVIQKHVKIPTPDTPLFLRTLESPSKIAMVVRKNAKSQFRKKVDLTLVLRYETLCFFSTWEKGAEANQTELQRTGVSVKSIQVSHSLPVVSGDEKVLPTGTHTRLFWEMFL